jgi:hypothetical protein
MLYVFIAVVLSMHIRQKPKAAPSYAALLLFAFGI